MFGFRGFRDASSLVISVDLNSGLRAIVELHVGFMDSGVSDFRGFGSRSFDFLGLQVSH